MKLWFWTLSAQQYIILARTSDHLVVVVQPDNHRSVFDLIPIIITILIFVLITNQPAHNSQDDRPACVVWMSMVMRMKNGNGFEIEYWPLIAIFMLNYKALYHSPCRTKSIRLHLYYIGSSMRYKSNLDCHLYILKQSIQIKYNFKHTYYAKSSKQTKSSTCLCIKILYY